MTTIRVERVGAPVHGTHDGLASLEQKFRLSGTTASAVADVMWTRAMIGAASILGEQPRARFETVGEARVVRDFSPVPGFRFDVALRRTSPSSFIVRFDQPDRATPYLRGEFLWSVSDSDGAAIFDEQINTPEARNHITEPLDGPKPSLRRWMFFRAGHAKVMDQALERVAALL